MKSILSLLVLGVIVGAFIVGFFYGKLKPVPVSPQQLTLEKILSIRQLHLVQHTYNDLFFLHKQNDKTKAIRAIVQVPVEITAYLDLKEMQFIHSGDTLQQLILPRARLREANYQVQNMVVREVRSFQLHAGKDLYPQIGQYLQAAVQARKDSIEGAALTNRILVQAEKEGREYIISALKELGVLNVQVRFAEDAVTNQFIPQSAESKKMLASLEAISFGFISLRK
jgi:hypothetical protein